MVVCSWALAHCCHHQAHSPLLCPIHPHTHTHTHTHLAAAGDFERLTALASTHAVRPLKPLLLLLAWDQCAGDISKASALLRMASSGIDDDDDDGSIATSATVGVDTDADAASQRNADPFTVVRRKLSYVVELAEFCAKHGGESGGDTLIRLTADLAVRPRPPDALRVLVNEAVDLGVVPDDEIVRVVGRQPAFNGVDVVEVSRDVTVLRSFCAIRHVIRALEAGYAHAKGHGVAASRSPLQSVEAPAGHDPQRAGVIPHWMDDVRASLVQARELVRSIQPPQYRVEVLENIFALLFLRATPSSASSSPVGTTATSPLSPVSGNDGREDFLATGVMVAEVLGVLRECLTEVQDEVAAGRGGLDDDGTDGRLRSTIYEPHPHTQCSYVNCLRVLLTSLPTWLSIHLAYSVLVPLCVVCSRISNTAHGQLCDPVIDALAIFSLSRPAHIDFCLPSFHAVLPTRQFSRCT